MKLSNEFKKNEVYNNGKESDKLTDMIEKDGKKIIKYDTISKISNIINKVSTTASVVLAGIVVVNEIFHRNNRHKNLFLVSSIMSLIVAKVSHDVTEYAETKESDHYDNFISEAFDLDVDED